MLHLPILMGGTGETTYPEFSKKLNMGILARELARIHRYEQALEVLRTLFLKHQLSIDQVKCYSLFLTEYFGDQRETTDAAFTSRNQIARLLRRRCAEYRDRTGKILIGTHNKDILELIKSLEAKNLIKRQSPIVEEKLYPSIFTFKRTRNKTHKTTYQPVGENLILEVSYAHVYDEVRKEEYETVTLRDASHILRWFFESPTQAEIDPVGLREQSLIEQRIFDPNVTAHDMDVKCRKIARMLRIDNYLPLFLFFLNNVEDVRLHYQTLEQYKGHKFSLEKLQSKDLSWLWTLDYTVRIARSKPEDLYLKPRPLSAASDMDGKNENK